MIKNTLFPGLALASLILAIPAHAAQTITSPYVEQGAIEVEAKAGYIIDNDDESDGAWETEASVAYGVTSFWETEFGFAVEDAGEGEDADFTALAWENKFQLAQPGEFFVDPGIKIEYARSLSGGPDEVGAKLLLAKQIGNFENVMNAEVDYEFGEDSDDEAAFGFAYGLSYAVADELAIGVEWYSDFGTLEDDSDDFDEQGHQFGPVAYGHTPFGLEYEFGVLAGVSDSAPDAELKLVLGYEF